MRDDDVVDTTTLSSSSGMADLADSLVADRYRLGTPLGQGAMANVYRAEDLRLNRDVALKLFHPGQEPAVRVRFGAEAQALARLSHPGLVGIFDAGVERDRPYLVMQLVDGESLRDRLLDGPMTADEVVVLGGLLATALAHVHANDVVHRDVKPSNIVLDATGTPHLADFGIALLLDAARMTGTNEVLGTAAYLSPEQILGEPVGAPADVYSLGLVLLECLSGELEYPGPTKVESALARLYRQPRLPAGLPRSLADLLAMMTALDATDRPTAAEAAARFATMRESPDSPARPVLLGRMFRPTKASGPGRAVSARLAGTGTAATRTAPMPTARQRPLFSGWRRFVIAGSGLAVAIIASAWMLTSLMPRTNGYAPGTGAGTGQQGVAGQGSQGGVGPQIAGVIHVAAPIQVDGPGLSVAASSTTTTAPAATTMITSTIDGPTPTTDDPVVTTTPDVTTTDTAAPTTTSTRKKTGPRRNRSTAPTTPGDPSAPVDDTTPPVLNIPTS